jgi:hypothetical protein
VDGSPPVVPVLAAVPLLVSDVSVPEDVVVHVHSPVEESVVEVSPVVASDVEVSGSPELVASAVVWAESFAAPGSSSTGLHAVPSARREKEIHNEVRC